MGTQRRKEVWKPFFYSSVLVSCLLWYLVGGSYTGCDYCIRDWEPLGSCWRLIAILTEV